MQWTALSIEGTSELLVRITQGGPATAAISAVHWQWLLLGIYVAVSATLLGRFFIGFSHTFRIWRNAHSIVESWTERSDVRSSAKIAAPATFGSTILLPADYTHWNPDKLTAVLSHERMHVREGDGYVQWLAVLHRAIFWFNPAAWWLKRQLVILAETTSDAAAMIELSDRTAYAEILLDIARFGSSTPEVVSMASRSLLSQRIEHILSKRQLSLRPARAVRVLAVMLVLPGIAIFAGFSKSSAVTPQETVMNARTSLGDHHHAKLLSTGPLELYYPAEAVKQGIEGYVVCRVTVDRAGRGVNAEVLSESPDGHGLGIAAVALLKDAKYTENHPSQIDVNVKFELDRSPGKPDPAT